MSEPTKAKMPERLVVLADSHRIGYRDLAGLLVVVADCKRAEDAAELVRRYNSYAGVLKAARVSIHAECAELGVNDDCIFRRTVGSKEWLNCNNARRALGDAK